jgi:hypothetical protein
MPVLGDDGQFAYQRGLQIGSLDISKLGITIDNGTIPNAVDISSSGMTVLDNLLATVFKTTNTGVNAGDVQMGTFNGSTGVGAFYDASAGTFNVAGSISAGALSIGTSPNWFRVDTNGNLWLGQDTYANAVANTFAVSNAGALYAKSATISGTITSGAGSAYTGNQIANAYIGNLSATKITTDTMSFDRASGGSIILGGSGDGNGVLIIKNSAGTEIGKMNNNGFIVRNSRGLFFEETTGGQYFDLSVNGSSQAIISLPSTNQLFIQNYAGDTNYFTVSSSKAYSENEFWVNNSIKFGDGTNLGNKSLYGCSLVASTSANLQLTAGGGNSVQLNSHLDVNSNDIDNCSVGNITTLNNTTINGDTVNYWTLHYYSDEILKKNIFPITNNLKAISGLNPVEFDYIDDKTNKKHFGFVAQEFEKIFPNLTGEDKNGIKGIDITQLIPLLVGAIQELKEEVEILKGKIQ